MTNRDYPAVVLPLTAEDGGGFLALAPDLPGCMGDGETAEAAVTDLRKAIEEWKDEAVRLGREVPRPGDYVIAMRKEQEKLYGLLQAQDELIKKQSKSIKQQDQEIQKAKEEIERIKAGILHLFTCDESSGNQSYLSLAGIFPNLNRRAARRTQITH
jgi:predicted RNase H-like HicB family nuclease